MAYVGEKSGGTTPGASKRSAQSDARALTVAGIHLSGANSPKTAFMALEGDLRLGPLTICKVYEKIGSFGSLFSDERLVDILSTGGPWQEVLIDSPLSVPPCVACTRPVCPGAVRCEDISVGYMLALSEKIRKKIGRKGRPINPQSQRLWDVLQYLEPPHRRQEPTYSSNQAPLVTRARTLQRRLNSLPEPITLRETSIQYALAVMLEPLGLEANVPREYRRFEHGLLVRQEVITKMIAAGWLRGGDAATEAARTVETFQALIAGVVAGFRAVGQVQARPDEYIAEGGWVELPDLDPTLSTPSSR